jgi:hypothetical protein
MEMLRNEIQAKVSEAWSKKLTSMKEMQAEQEQQRR